MEIPIEMALSKFQRGRIIKAITGIRIPFTANALVMGDTKTHHPPSTALEDPIVKQALRPGQKSGEFARVVNKSGRRSYLIDGDGIRSTGQEREEKYLWSDFWRASYDKKYYFLRTSNPDDYFVIPKSCLNGQDLAEFESFLKDDFEKRLGRPYIKH